MADNKPTPPTPEAIVNDTHGNSITFLPEGEFVLSTQDDQHQPMEMSGTELRKLHEEVTNRYGSLTKQLEETATLEGRPTQPQYFCPPINPRVCGIGGLNSAATAEQIYKRNEADSQTIIDSIHSLADKAVLGQSITLPVKDVTLSDMADAMVDMQNNLLRLQGVKKLDDIERDMFKRGDIRTR